LVQSGFPWTVRSLMFTLYTPIYCSVVKIELGLSSVGTVDNHGNTEIMETVIFVKCCECCDFAKMPCFLPKCIVLRFHKSMLFLISIIWSLLC